MYPSNRVFETGLTDGDGRFAIDNVPCTSFSLLCTHTNAAWSREIAFSRSGTWRLNLKYRQTGQDAAELIVVDLKEPAGDSIMPNATDVAPQGTDLQAAPSPRRESRGRLSTRTASLSPGRRWRLCTKDKGVIVQAGELLPTTWGGKTSEIVETDAQGRFSFPRGRTNSI